MKPTVDLVHSRIELSILEETLRKDCDFSFVLKYNHTIETSSKVRVSLLKKQRP